MTALLDVSELCKRFPAGKRSWLRGLASSQVFAVDDVHLTVGHGETVGLVGESGCGKSTLVRLITRLLDPTEGSIRFDTRELALVRAQDFATDADRANIQMVFQDAGESINPRFTAADAIADPLRRLRGLSGAALKARVEEAATQCGLPLALLERFPHQLSGGQRARVGIARAIGTRPKLLVLDEPTAALDVSVQVTVLKLLRQLKQDLGMSYIFVSHDLNVVRLLCDRVVVMYLGRVVETGPAQSVFEAPLHPYTRGLVAAVPRLDGVRAEGIRLSGDPRSPIDPDPNACRFHGRCPIGTDRCGTEMPELRRIGDREVACHYAETAAPRLSLATVNALEQDRFVAVLGAIFENAPWVAAAAHAALPAADIDTLHAAMMDAVRKADRATQIAFLAGHPELATAQAMTAHSTQEQAGLGLTRLETAEAERFATLNAAYTARFGFPFIIAVRALPDRSAILPALAARDENDIETEIANALAQIAMITRFRLADCIIP
jgi:OHCU decarboxylase